MRVCMCVHVSIRECVHDVRVLCVHVRCMQNCETCISLSVYLCARLCVLVCYVCVCVRVRVCECVCECVCLYVCVSV